MPFTKMTTKKYPLRLWGLKGYPDSGKSTFSARMRGPLAVIDADHRFDEVLHLATDAYAISDNPEDHVDADRIADCLKQNMTGAKIGTVVVDSVTAIISPLVVQAIIDKDSGKSGNLAAGFKAKAMAMRQLQDAVTRWGTDCLWIYHMQDARDEKGREVVKASLSAMELARLTRSINMQLELLRDKQTGRHGVKIVWARRGRNGVTLWDDDGLWKGMPERIESACYDGLTEIEQDRLEQDPPKVFATPESAMDWGMRKGCFRGTEHAKNAYDKLKTDHSPKSALEMRDLWVADVERRLAEKAVGANGHTDEPAGTQNPLAF